MPTVTAVVPPVGGAIFLSIQALSPMTITRTPQSTGIPVQIYNGVAVPYYIDQGEGYSTNVEFLPNDTYTYTIADSSGSTSTDPLVTTASITINPDQITSVIVKLIKAGINNLVLTQPGWIKPRVFHALPTSGTPQLPFIVVTFDLLQQNDNEKAAMTRAAIWQYVRARESYDFADAQYRYDVASLMSNPTVQSTYQSWFLDKGPGSTSPQVTVGKKGQISVEMVSLSMVRPNVALVRFRRTVTMYGSDPQTSTWTATVGFENVATLPVSARLADPSGLIVTNYQALKDSP